MNANELAKYLDRLNGYMDMPRDILDITQPAATMIRQQQAEIEALKLQLHTTLTNRDLRTYDGKLDMNNEPVAWKVIETDDEGSFTTFTEVEPVWTDNAIPLYTHSAKTLTDEEIHQIFRDESGFEIDACPIAILDFARAILRKASE